MTLDIAALRHPKEKIYGVILAVIGGLVWFALAAFIVLTANLPLLAMVLFYCLIFWLASIIVRALLRAYMMGHFVMVGPEQFPHLHRMVVEGAAAIGLDETPITFVYNSSGVMNAMALRLIGRRRYVWLTSQLIDADDNEQVRFVIGHELGHHAAGHLDAFPFLVKLPGHLIPFLGAAYSRARELTCDRVGAALSGNLDASRSALQMLACGSAKLNAAMNPAAFQAQDELVPSIAGWILHIFSHYPRHTARVAALSQWSGQGAPLKPSIATTRTEPRFS